MGIAIVEECTVRSDPTKVLRDAARYAEYLKMECPWVQASFWLRCREDPSRLLALRVFDRYSDYLHDSQSTRSVFLREQVRAATDSEGVPPAEYDVCQSTGGTAREARFFDEPQWSSSLTTWRFRPGVDATEPVRAIAEYLRSLKRRRHSAVFSLWLRSRSEPERFLHVTTFKRPVSLDLEGTSEALRRLEQRLSPSVAETRPEDRLVADVIVSGPTSLPRVALGRGWRPGSRRASAELGV